MKIPSYVSSIAASWPTLRNPRSFVGQFGGSASQVLLLVLATGLAKAVVVLVSPALARLYSPENFGELAVYLAILSFPIVLGAWRLEMAIPLANDDSQAANLLVASLLLVLGTAGLSAIGVALVGEQLGRALNAPGLYQYLWLSPFAICAAGWFRAYNYWAIRRKAFGRIAVTRCAQSGLQVCIQLILGFFSLGTLGLLIGDLSGRAQGAATIGTLTWREEKQIFRQISFRGLWQAVSRYRHFPLLLSGASLLHCISENARTLFLCAQYGGQTIGFLALSLRVAQLPLALAGEGIGQVFVSRAREGLQNRLLPKMTLKLYELLLAIALPCALLLVVAAPELFTVAFGTRWEIAGSYTQLLTPWLFVVFVASPISTLIAICERQGVDLAFQSALLVARLLALLTCFWASDPAIPIGLYAAVSAAFWFGYLIWLLQLSGNSATLVLLVMLRELVRIVPLILPLLLVRLFSSNANLIVATACVVAALIIVRFLVMQLPQLRQR